MDYFSVWHWMIVVAVVLLLFGRGKLSDLMGDVAQGIKAFKKGIAEDEPPPAKRDAALLRGADTSLSTTRTEQHAGDGSACT